MDLDDVGRFIGGCFLTMLGSVVLVVLMTLAVKFAIGFYVPIVLWLWRLW
jgi:hypothetical protein